VPPSVHRVRFRTWVGDWLTDDRATWRTDDGVWLAQIQRRSDAAYVRAPGRQYAIDEHSDGWLPRAELSRRSVS
jgi:hypothetical protein